MSDRVGTEQRPGPLTVELAAWALVGLLAATLRLFQLGWRPLSESEAVQALAAYEFTHGTTALAPAGTNPALFVGNVLGFTLLGASDMMARWLPALAGVILVLLPYGLRHRLGRGGALAASLLLAISPSVVYFSRSLDSAIVVSVCGLALAVGLINYLDSRRAAGLYLAATAAGLGLCAGPSFFSLLLVFSTFALVLYLADRLVERGAGWASVVAAWSNLREQQGLTVRAGVILAATFGLTATALVLHPAGLGNAADLIAAWVQGFLPEKGGQRFFYSLLLLLRYELPILFLGLLEAGWTVYAHWSARRPAGRIAPPTGWGWGSSPRSTFPFTAFLIYWAVAATLIVLVAGHRPAGNMLLVVVPLALLGGQGMERAGRWISRRGLWLEAGAIAAVAMVLLAFLYLQLASYSLIDDAPSVSFANLTLPASSTYLVLASVVLVLLLGLAALAWVWRGTDALLAGAWLATVLLLGLIGIKALWALNFNHSSAPRELVAPHATRTEVRTFVEELEALSLAEAGDAHTLPVAVDRNTGPAVAWYLRQFDQRVPMSVLSIPPGTAAAVTLALEEPAIGETYRGQGFPLRSHWQPWGLRGQDLVRWLLYTSGDQPAIDQEVVLWVAGAP